MDRVSQYLWQKWCRALISGYPIARNLMKGSKPIRPFSYIQARGARLQFRQPPRPLSDLTQEDSDMETVSPGIRSDRIRPNRRPAVSSIA